MEISRYDCTWYNKHNGIPFVSKSQIVMYLVEFGGGGLQDGHHFVFHIPVHWSELYGYHPPIPHSMEPRITHMRAAELRTSQRSTGLPHYFQPSATEHAITQSKHEDEE